MPKRIDQEAEKRVRNEIYADKFIESNNREERKKLREDRIATREADWLEKMGIVRDPSIPLIAKKLV